MYCAQLGVHVPYVKLSFQILDELLKITIRDVVLSNNYYVYDLLYVKAVPLAGSAPLMNLSKVQEKPSQQPAVKSYSSSSMHLCKVHIFLNLLCCPNTQCQQELQHLQYATETQI